MLNMPKIFQDSSLGQKHAILRQVFKQGLTFREEVFRTPFINPEFGCNLLILKEKGLLFLEQPFDSFEEEPSGGEWGIRTRGPFDKSTVFKTAAIDHSANSPRQKYKLRSILQTLFRLF